MHVMKSTPDNISGIKEQQQELSKMKQTNKKKQTKKINRTSVDCWKT